MISCVDFIPAYSEFFGYLEDRGGHAEVEKLWNYLFVPDGKSIPLINFLEKEGVRGCWSYWSGTLNEEAADFTMYLNEKRGFFMNVMHYCPSKGRLLKLAEAEGYKPYPYYCMHCDYYRLAAEKAGLRYIYNFNGIDKATCSMLIYDPSVFDGRVIIDEDTQIMDRKASQNEYFHRDFHSGMNNGIRYLGEHYGTEAVEAYLVRYTENVLKKPLADFKVRGLDAAADYVRAVYDREKAPEVLTLTRDADTLRVHVAYCPAVRHLHETGRVVSPWFRYTTETVMARLAAEGGLTFAMDAYNEETGEVSYHFSK